QQIFGAVLCARFRTEHQCALEPRGQYVPGQGGFAALPEPVHRHEKHWFSLLLLQNFKPSKPFSPLGSFEGPDCFCFAPSSPCPTFFSSGPRPVFSAAFGPLDRLVIPSSSRANAASRLMLTCSPRRSRIWRYEYPASIS